MYNAVLKARGQSLKTRRAAPSTLPIPPNVPRLAQLSSLELSSREMGQPKSNAVCCKVVPTEPHVLVTVMPSVTSSSWCCDTWGAVRKRMANTSLVARAKNHRSRTGRTTHTASAHCEHNFTSISTCSVRSQTPLGALGAPQPSVSGSKTAEQLPRELSTCPVQRGRVMHSSPPSTSLETSRLLLHHPGGHKKETHTAFQYLETQHLFYTSSTPFCTVAVSGISSWAKIQEEIKAGLFYK